MRHLVFDTETTNLIGNTLKPIGKQPQIIEFFGLILDTDLKIVDTLDHLCKPDLPIEKLITKITSITNDMVANAPKFSFCALDIKKFIESCDIVVAHNLSYDKQIVDFEMSRASMKVEWPSRGVCTVEATEYMKGYRLRLNDLHMELFGEAFEGAHRAEHDVRALARCYIELINRGEI